MTTSPKGASQERPRTIIEEVREDFPYLLDGYKPGYEAGWRAALAWAGFAPAAEDSQEAQP